MTSAVVPFSHQYLSILLMMISPSKGPNPLTITLSPFPNASINPPQGFMYSQNHSGARLGGGGRCTFPKHLSLYFAALKIYACQHTLRLCHFCGLFVYLFKERSCTIAATSCYSQVHRRGRNERSGNLEGRCQVEVGHWQLPMQIRRSLGSGTNQWYYCTALRLFPATFQFSFSLTLS